MNKALSSFDPDQERLVSKPRHSRKGHRRPAPLTEEKLKQAALDYLARYAASESTLRKTLERRILRQSMLDKDFAANTTLQQQLRQVIDSVITAHKRAGNLNDAAFAETKIAGMRRSGTSKRRIEQKLAHKGVAKQTVAKALQGFDSDQMGDTGDAELQAARTFARKKRLGSFRTQTQNDEGDKEERRQREAKDIAALARAGFSYDTAKRALGTSSDFED
ncbi:MAG: RecX family transcriptional regulator [Alphaproteobacteria bacterium]|nr:RecX family transcriptional regulator [Alphaproteobacteria bacterium]